METIKTKQPKQFPWKKTIFITLGGLIFIVLAVLVWAYLQIQKPIPQELGTLELNGLSAEVSVYRDDQGVPHIEANNDYDLYFAQGFVTAQDRLFQMDLSRRQASGQLAEVIGESMLDQDRYFRTFGLRRAAEASEAAYDEETYGYLEAYAAGVNAFMERAIDNGELPIEFRLAGYEPTPWEPLDSLTIGKYMAYDLSGNWQGQAFRHWLAQHVTEEEALDLMPAYPNDGPVILDLAKSVPIDIETAFATTTNYLPHPFSGSNNWVLAGERTASGEPLLADDPHLGLATPSIWYETHLTSPSVNVTGVIFAGVPGIILGSNEDIAWGVTNVGPDVQQLYFEQRHPDNASMFLYDDEWYEAEVITETILVADQEPYEHEITITKNGPLLSEYASFEEEAEYALSMRWTAHEATTELQAVLDFNRADNWDTFADALTSFQAPAQNFVFASKDGTIAYRANGLIPIRPDEDDALVPVPGWDPKYQWKGYIPWDELPTIINPESGIISTANNQIVGEDYPYHITHTWAQPYRHQRIIDVLYASNDHTAEDMMNLQMDVVNLQAEEFVPILIEALEMSELTDVEQQAVTMLQSWNREDRKEEPGPLLFHFWMDGLTKQLFEDDIPTDLYGLFEGRANIVDEMIRAASQGQPGPWIEKAGGLDTLAYKSFQQAVERASELQGATPNDWEWGAFHKVVFNHPLAAISPLNYLFNGSPLPVDGSRITVKAASYNTDTGVVTNGAGWRGVMDLSDLENTHHLVGPGQSGHVFSDSYHNQREAWVHGDYHVTSIDPTIYQPTDRHLTLIPQ
ncbi:penicillin acylase family protein [Shouchella hunanensis]|uniref:Penicillin acylase family protein n=1 Tax=Shouchella hunanensis TaxID=766894 RepID=A0ABY7W3B4_9BACI|nr:penicillin acylase family protein [Shouchella hunanensis]WDF02551.1 penicillin acylase family protein [Shouchella hunanensis]